MIRKVYAVKDELAGFSSVITDDSHERAIRGFKSTVFRMLGNDSASAPYVDDMSLWAVGDFDTDSGFISSYANPILVIRGSVVRAEYDRSILEAQLIKERSSKEVGDHESEA